MQILQSSQAQTVKKVVKIVLLVMIALVIAAIVWGIVAPLLGIGGMTFGWQDYRYDETGYTVGEGTIPSDHITSIDLDWVDGRIEIIACGDTFVSLTESADSELPDSARLRWRVDENGVLSIKYRKSSWFLGFGHENRNKTLILRIPERLLPTLKLLDVEAVSADVTVTEISVSTFDYENVSGNLTARGVNFGACDLEAVSGDLKIEDSNVGSAEIELVSGDLQLSSFDCPVSLDIESVSGNAELWLPENASFTLDHETTSGRLISDFSMKTLSDRYVCGEGKSTFRVETVSGSLILAQNNDAD